MTSAVIRMPRALAQRTTSRPSAVLTCATWTRERVCSASIASRAMMLASATGGQPGRPSRPETSPSWQQACGPARLGVLAVLGDDPAEGPDVLQRPAHDPAVGDAAAVVGEDPHAGPRAVHEPELGELDALEALGDRADRHDVDEPGGAAEVEDPLGRLGGVGDRGGVGHGEHRGVAADRRGPRAGGDRLGVLAARLAQVGVQVDEPGQQDEAVGVDALGVRGGVDGADLRRRRRR